MSELFIKIEDKNDIKQSVSELFGLDLPISGGWGYDEQSAICIKSLDKSKEEMFLLLGSLRANVELSALKAEDERFGGINPSIKSIEEVGGFVKVTFSIEAMRKNIYNELINEYKEGYGKADFDIAAHFEKRKQASIKEDMICYFQLQL